MAPGASLDQKGKPVMMSTPGFENAEDGPHYSDFELATLLDYWRAVEDRTKGYLASLGEEDLQRKVEVEDWPGHAFTVEDLVMHVMFHETRHTAQIVLLLRQQGIQPPYLDLLFHILRSGRRRLPKE